jgi:hypothetical protein
MKIPTANHLITILLIIFLLAAITSTIYSMVHGSNVTYTYVTKG